MVGSPAERHARPRACRPAAAWLAALLAAAALTSCDATPPEQLPPPALPCTALPLSASATTTDVSFDPTTLLCVHLDLADADFDALRVQNRFGTAPEGAQDALVAHFSEGCVAPYPAGFTWFETGLRVGGAQLARVGVRKKGLLGSVQGQGLRKPSLKLKLDRNVPGQRLGDTERITLNNNNQDPSHVRACLAYAVFRAAGHPAPRCNLASVVRGGVPLGAYTHVEAVKKRFLQREFGKPPGARLGSLYEGALCDFTPDFSLPFADGGLGRWDPKTSDTDPSGGPLLALSVALQAPDETLLDALAPVLNVDRFVTFWALEVLVSHRDGYAANRNNFFVYFDPNDGGRAVFVPWGADSVFGAIPDDTDLTPYTFGELTRRLSHLPQMRERLSAELQRLLTIAWDEDALLAQAERFAKQVRTAQDDPDYDDHLDAVRTWIKGRRAQVERMADVGLAPGSATQPSCTSLPGGFITDPQTGLHVLAGFVFGL